MQKKFILKILIFVFEIILVFTLFFGGIKTALFLRGFWQQSISEIKDSYLVSISDDLNIDISYSLISPSILNYFEVKDLNIKSRGLDNSKIYIKRLKIYYNFFKLFSSTDLSTIFYKILIDHVDAEIDLSKEMPLILTKIKNYERIKTPQVY